MKVLFILHSSGAAEGSSIAALAIITQLKAYGIDVHAVCPKQGELVQKLQEIEVNTSFIRYSSALYPKIYTIKSFLSLPLRFLKLLWYNHTAERTLVQLAKTYQPDVIHTNVGVLRVGYYVGKRLGIPHVWHIRETEIGINCRHYPSLTYQRHLLNNNCINIAITEDVKQYYQLDSSNSRVVYDGVFSSFIHSPDNVVKENYFLFVGRVLQSKGADWAVESFIKIADDYPEVELWLAGSTNNKFATKLISETKGTKYASRIRFLGQRNDIYDLMSHAQAVLVPSVLEGFGFITVEAMLNRTLVIGRNTGGTKEQFDNGVKLSGHEIALRCESIDEMARHMAEVFQNGQDYYIEMIDRAEKVVHNMYTIENNANQIIEIYKQVTR